MDIPDGIALTAFDETFYQDPYGVYATLRRLDPVHQDQVSFYENSWTITDHDTVRALLTDERLSVDPRKIGVRADPRADNAVTLRAPGMMNLDNPEHARLRQLVHKAFTPASVSTFADAIERIVATCLDAIDAPTFDAVAALAKPVPTIVIAEYIGVGSEHHQQFKAWTDDLLLQGYPVPSEAQWQQIVAADAALRDHLAGVITTRRSNPQEDLVSRLIAAQNDDERLGDDEILALCYLLIGAGNFTTTDLISNSLFNLLQTGHRAEDYTLLVEECLRFDPPAMNVRRFALEDIALGEKRIERGSVVNLVTAAANHDPARFPAADRFDPDQANAQHLSFGRGIHHCLGAPLARLETAITLREVFARYPNLRLVGGKRSRRMDFRGFVRLEVAEG